MSERALFESSGGFAKASDLLGGDEIGPRATRVVGKPESIVRQDHVVAVNHLKTPERERGVTIQPNQSASWRLLFRLTGSHRRMCIPEHQVRLRLTIQQPSTVLVLKINRCDQCVAIFAKRRFHETMESPNRAIPLLLPCRSSSLAVRTTIGLGIQTRHWHHCNRQISPLRYAFKLSLRLFKWLVT